MTEATDLAWAAGIIDGEGCLHITNAAPSKSTRSITRSYNLHLRVAMCHRPTLDKLHAIFGSGSIHPVTRSNPLHNQAWVLSLTSWNALDAINAIRPYLVTKAYEADIAIEFMALPRAPRGGCNGSRKTPPEIVAQRHQLWDKMRRAKGAFAVREERRVAA